MRTRTSVTLSLVALAACVLAVGFSGASFTDTTQNPQTVSAATDFLPPIAAASVIAKTQGGATGYIKAAGTYYVYANVTDAGNPASGVASVKADVSGITTGQTAATLTTGSYSVGGVSYNYRSAELEARSSLAPGSQSYTLALADSAGNSRSPSFSVMVNGAFAGSDFETGNAPGGTEGKPEKGDTVTFVFNQAPEPGSIVSGWDGSGTKSVSVSIADSVSNDSLTVSGATIGSVALKGNFTEEKTTTFTGSSMSLSGSTVTIVLGTESAGNPKTETGKTKPVWTPSASVFDQAWNACSTANVTGKNAKQF